MGLVKNFYGLFLPRPRTANDVSLATIRLQIASDRKARRTSSIFKQGEKPKASGKRRQGKSTRDGGRREKTITANITIRGHLRPIIQFN